MNRHNDFDPGFQQLLDGAKRRGIPSRELERELLIKAKAGDIDARNALIEFNVLTVAKVAIRMRHNGLSEGELVGPGVEGLIAAIEDYDLTKNYRLMGYATWKIYARMQIAIHNEADVIRVPGHIKRELRIARRRCQADGVPETPENIAARSEMNRDCVIAGARLKPGSARPMPSCTTATRSTSRR